MFKSSVFWAVALPALLALIFFTSSHSNPDASSEATSIAAAGDIASCDSDGDEETAKLVAGTDPSAVLTLGDNAYEDGSAEQFANCYEPSWGQFKSITHPAIGNHDYGDEGWEGEDSEEYDTSAYFDYFGSAAGERGKGWYSYDLGNWHVVALNSDCDDGVGCDPYSEQIQWLSDDLAATDKGCILAYWHHPLYSSGYHGPDPKMRSAWNVLYSYGADLVLNGHDHDYERFAPQDGYGNVDPHAGMR